MKKMLLVLAVIMVVLTGCNRKDSMELDPIIKNKEFNRVSYLTDEDMVEEKSENFFFCQNTIKVPITTYNRGTI